jgi:hypothetical protein
MKPFSHLWQYLSKVFLKWEISEANIVEKVKTFYFLFNSVFSAYCVVYWIVLKNIFGTSEATNDGTILFKRVVCRIGKATRSHAHAHTQAPVRTHTHTHTSTRAHISTSRQKCTSCFSIVTVVSCKLLNVTSRLINSLLTLSLKTFCQSVKRWSHSL